LANTQCEHTLTLIEYLLTASGVSRQG
jgi:hypothetical protein